MPAKATGFAEIALVPTGFVGVPALLSGGEISTEVGVAIPSLVAFGLVPVALLSHVDRPVSESARQIKESRRAQGATLGAGGIAALGTLSLFGSAWGLFTILMLMAVSLGALALQRANHDHSMGRSDAPRTLDGAS